MSCTTIPGQAVNTVKNDGIGDPEGCRQAVSLPVLVLLNFNRAYAMHDAWSNALSGADGSPEW